MELKKDNYHEIISIWLLILIIQVFLMIIVGGLTRLTDSGLSITEWELFKGVLPPFSNEDWENYFNLYKEIPQFKYINPLMTIDEFKVIFYWEYFHRLLGRIIGLTFLIPLIVFSFQKLIDKKNFFNFCFIFFLILLQGIIGWYMVESGLTNKTTVSHFRLSFHLFFAFVIISFLFWNYLNYKFKIRKIFFNFKNKLPKILFLLILLQIVIGALVSGLDAGLIYQTWPKMNLSYYPDDLVLLNQNFMHLFNNQSFVQFLHRVVAYLIIFFMISILIKLYLEKKFTYIKNYLTVFLFIIIQILLGIFTLISGLDIYLASLHQITSVILVLSVLYLNHKLS